MKRKLMTALLIAVIAIASISSVALAVGADDQPVEWEGNPGSLRWSLSYAGQGIFLGWDECDWNDYVFYVNKNASADPDRYRIYSFNSQVQSAFSGKSPIGHGLQGTNPYLCLGFTDTLNAGGTGNVASNLFVWVK